MRHGPAVAVAAAVLAAACPISAAAQPSPERLKAAATAGMIVEASR